MKVTCSHQLFHSSDEVVNCLPRLPLAQPCGIAYTIEICKVKDSFNQHISKRFPRKCVLALRTPTYLLG